MSTRISSATSYCSLHGAAGGGDTDAMFVPSSEFLNNDSNHVSDHAAAAVNSSSLSLDAVGLVGREKERRVLEQAYDRVCCRVQQAPSEVLLVKGASGTGKSALISQTLSENIDRESMGLFVQGKNDIHSSAPYEAVVSAATELCQAVVESEYYLGDVKEHLQSVLSAEDCRLLLNLIPAARVLLCENNAEDSNHSDATDGSFSVHEFALKQFLRVLCKFWNAVASVHPVVLFLDDLQWSDAMSKDFLTSLVHDTTSTNLLIIGAFREGEFQWSVLDDNDEKEEEEKTERQEVGTTANNSHRRIRISKVKLGPLRQTHVNEIVSRATQRRPDETADLGEVIHRKTNGNVLFTLQFLDMLQTTGLLSFSFRTNQWEWGDAADIASGTDVSDNVAELLTQKMTRLSKRAQTVLMIAACLGHTFDETVLGMLVSSSSSSEQQQRHQLCPAHFETDSAEGPDLLQQALKESAKAGLIEQASSGGQYKFSHDAIQQAAFNMVPEGMDADSLRAGFGERVLQLSRTKDGRDWMLFSAVDLLTRRESTTTASKLHREELAGLCLEASGRALAKSAFITAAMYADRGYALLDVDSRWKTHYSLCLELCARSAEMHHSYGDHDGASHAISDTIQHGRCIEDKLPAHRVLVAIRLSQKDMHGAIRESLGILKELGVKVPENPNKFHVLLHLMKVKRMLKRRRASDLLDLPRTEDSKIVFACRALHEIAVPAWISNNEGLSLVACLMTMRLTLTYGLSQYSSIAFASYGVVLSHVGALDEAYEYGCLALRMQEKYGTKQTFASTLATTHFFLSHLRDPIVASIEPLGDAYEQGMRAGDVNFAAHCLIVRAQLGIHGSMKLDHLETQMRGYCSFLHDYQLDSSLSSILPTFQLVLNLRGSTKNVLNFEGEAIENEADFVEQRKHGDKMPLVYLQNARILLFVVLDELELADAERCKDPSEGPGTYYTKCCNLFFTALACLGLARRRQKERKDRKSRHFQRLARKHQRQLETYVDNGSINCIPFVKLLDAEMANSCSKRVDHTVKLYEDAIGAAARCGFRLCRGLAYEKAGEYLLEHGDKFLAKDYLSQAWLEFSDYGAVAKLTQMERKYGNTCSFKGKTMQGSSRPSSLTQPHSIKRVSASCKV